MAESTSETPVLDLLADMTANSVAASSLDPETLMLVRIAALVAVDAPSFSYVLNLEVASELDIDPERIRGVLAAIAPIVGTPRVASATGKIVEALAVEMEIAELEELSEEIADEEVYDQVEDEEQDDEVADQEVADEVADQQVDDEEVEDDEVEDDEVEDEEVEDDEVEDEEVDDDEVEDEEVDDDEVEDEEVDDDEVEDEEMDRG
jgi:alkylhydroperoxidase/carboxymuconolactone decarboxylase family protein YurZ